MKKVMLDTDVVNDFVLERAPFDVEAQEIFRHVARGTFAGYITSITPVNVFCFGRKAKGRDETLKALTKLLQILTVCVADKHILQNALASNITDYEDAVQHDCAVKGNLDLIVTRNLSDYKNATLPVYSPADFLNLLNTP